MADRPIIFSGPMVRALLEGRKTQTRRVLKVQPPNRPGWKIADQDEDGVMWMSDDGTYCACRLPYAPGDRLYVRESIIRQETDQGVGYQTYAADGAKVFPLTQWYHRRNAIPSIHMPRWASRLTLTVTDVRVQRLQDISEDDARAEGIDDRDAVCGFSELWDSLHGPDAWDANPWVVALTLTVAHGNIDQIGRTP